MKEVKIAAFCYTGGGFLGAGLTAGHGITIALIAVLAAAVLILLAGC